MRIRRLCRESILCSTLSYFKAPGMMYVMFKVCYNAANRDVMLMLEHAMTLCHSNGYNACGSLGAGDVPASPFLV